MILVNVLYPYFFARFQRLHCWFSTFSGYHCRNFAQQPGHPDVCGATDLARRPHGQQRLRPEASTETGDLLSPLQTHLPVRWHRHRRF